MLLEGEGIEGQCSCEGTLVCRGNPTRKAYDKPCGGPDLSGKEGKLLLFPMEWRRVTSLIYSLVGLVNCENPLVVSWLGTWVACCRIV
jgi:hypothetical protein